MLCSFTHPSTHNLSKDTNVSILGSSSHSEHQEKSSSLIFLTYTKPRIHFSFTHPCSHNPFKDTNIFIAGNASNSEHLNFGTCANPHMSSLFSVTYPKKHKCCEIVNIHALTQQIFIYRWILVEPLNSSSKPRKGREAWDSFPNGAMRDWVTPPP